SPTGLVDPSAAGPAIPVTATARLVPKHSRTPQAIASATSLLTAPTLSKSSRETSSSRSLTWFEYAITPPAKYDELPGCSVINEPTIPPVDDSATATVKPAWRSAS